HATETAPGRRRPRKVCRCEPPITACRAGVEGLLEEGPERGFPSGTEGGNAQRALELFATMAGEVEQRIGFGNAHPLDARRKLDDFIARLDLALFDHAQVETRPALGNEQRRHPRLVHPDADAITRHARLRHLEYGAPDSVAVPDAHV